MTAAVPPAAPILSVRDLHLAIAGRRRHTPILRGVSLDIAPGEVHGLVGESGAGKTMIGKAVLGIQPSQARIVGGSVLFDGSDVTHLPERERRGLMGRGMGLIPQDPMTSLNPAYRVGAQIADVLRLHLGLDRKAAGARALELLGDVHIRAPERVLRQYPHELSGGMRQRVLIAIAFACRPKLIVADEPVAKICDRVTVLHGGRVLESGDTRRIVEAPGHDYTSALIAATPRHDRPGDRLRPVPEALTARLNAEALAWDAARAAGEREHG
ncbi:MAG: ABC transporter ATP-binding protein [Defluviicoccus sp.]|nr:ABC transporter ATP-binding protein [Defluviicoccus sp.]